MRKLFSRILVLGGAIAVLGLLEVAPADAYTCSSACNQLRRACNVQAKAQRKIDNALCADTRDACKVTCEGDPGHCATVCQTALTDCLTGCGIDVVCQDACNVAAAECPSECPGCCNFGRQGCRTTAKGVRDEARAACTLARTTCNTDCTSVNGACIRQAQSARKSCDRGHKVTANTCKQGCGSGPGRRACVRTCRRIMNEGLKLCAADEASTIGTECIQTGP